MEGLRIQPGIVQNQYLYYLSSMTNVRADVNGWLDRIVDTLVNPVRPAPPIPPVPFVEFYPLPPAKPIDLNLSSIPTSDTGIPIDQLGDDVIMLDD